MRNNNKIQRLNPEVAKQIAAGEVIERPSSVLKELLENSIDAGANNIEVSVERGGMQLVQVVDNGCGILPLDLPLAVVQHATSKIMYSEDLYNIQSLGFRGEALASIDSVAKIIIISRAQDGFTAQDEFTTQGGQAWQYRDGKKTIAAHPVGTTIKIQDLFYNVPARKKFLRSEKTEYTHLEEVFKRIALGNFDISFTLINHGKIVKKLSACANLVAKTNRVAQLCGNKLVEQALSIDCEHNGMHLCGWLGKPESARSIEPHQYFFINNRIIRDRVINHAIKEVYQELLPAGKRPFYCLYLTIEPGLIDINVHPTKHEVRFFQARTVHAFLTSALTECLNGGLAMKEESSAQKLCNLDFNLDFNNLKKSSGHNQINLLNNIFSKIIICTNQQNLFIINFTEAIQKFILDKLTVEFNKKQRLGKYLLEPPEIITISGDTDVMESAVYSKIAELGFEISLISAGKIAVRSQPKILTDYNLKITNYKALIGKLLQILDNKTADIASTVFKTVVSYIKYNNENIDNKLLQQLLNCNLQNKKIVKQVTIDELLNLLFV